MNLNILEKIAREAKKSTQVAKSIVNPVEHKDLSSLSMQIAANMRHNSSAAAAPIPHQVYGAWI